MATTTPHTPPEAAGHRARQEAMTRMQLLLSDAVETLGRNLTCGDPAIEVSAARELIDRALIPEASYSFKGHLSNQTEYELTLKEKEAGGKWTQDPPKTVAPGATAYWSGEYEGFDYSGRVVYQGGPNKGELKMTWDIPLFGKNTIDAWTTITGTSVTHEGGSGWQAEVWYYLKQVKQA